MNVIERFAKDGVTIQLRAYSPELFTVEEYHGDALSEKKEFTTFDHADKFFKDHCRTLDWGLKRDRKFRRNERPIEDLDVKDPQVRLRVNMRRLNGFFRRFNS